MWNAVLYGSMGQLVKFKEIIIFRYPFSVASMIGECIEKQ